ncbi:MAG TPA: hypothetical protein PLE19_10865 [Planctomycetota bacterium]|nr:hypothetical protein [Planctomycetota bacterium]HRR79009.1 hypothetical protein [Planctomycetota bacterium]HRT93850.1 hypothetical protein [Planctomycetota bacterium]
MPDPDLCRRCGRCCYAKLILNGEIVYTPFPCPYLDEATRLCTVYERRHAVNPDCLPVEMGIRLGVFPPDCPYVSSLPDYVPPRLGMTPEEIEAYADEIRELQDAVRAPANSRLPRAVPTGRKRSAP